MLIILSVIGICLCALNKRGHHRNFWLIILTIITVGLQALALADIHYRFGTSVDSTTTQRQIQPIVNFPVTNSVLLYKNVRKGTDNKQIYIYKYTKNGSKQTTYTDKIKVKLVKNADHRALRSMRVDHLQYIDRFDQILFAGINNNNQVLKTTVTFHLPKGWQVMTTKQAKTAGNKLKDSNSKLKRIVKIQLAEYLAKHPETANDPEKIKNEASQILNEQVKKMIETY
ncbi:DUF4811 domain-containing protein [Lactiplantibacillus plantarum]|uniref:DUF4811 domain-containing protein n=1 Tax=Lactiplantibacillus plantarum TaxID=1590 RepID=UPI003EE4C4FB